MDNLKKVRGQLKARVTRLENYFQKVISDPALGIATLKVRRNLFVSTWGEFESIQSQIEIADENELITDERDMFENSYTELLTKIDEYIDTKTPLILPNGESNVPIGALSGNETQPQPNANAQINLPRINLPKFNGKTENWLSFYESFKALIHENNTLSKLQKFHFLKSCLTDEASNLIETLSISENNYQIGYDLLIDRYYNKRLMVKNHVNDLFNLKPVIKDSASSLRELIDKVLTKVKILKNLELPTDSWDVLIVHLITTKLDYISMRDYESTLGTDIPNLKDLTNFLTNRCNLLQSLQLNKKPVQTQPSKFQTSRASAHVTTGKISCYLCKKPHHIYRCFKLLNLSVADRLKEINKLKICTNCLGPNHEANTCIKEGCRICKQPHNSILHDTSTDQNDDLPVSATPVSNICNHTVNGQILLSTAKVKVYDSSKMPHDARVLLDPGSTSNFITERMVNKLKLPTRNVNINISGINANTSVVTKTTVVTLKSCYNDFKTKISCSLVPRVTEKLPLYSVDVSHLNIPSEIQLADPEFNISSDIDILCGVELFWKIVRSEQFKLLNSDTHFQNTHFGWVIAGKITYNNSNKKRSLHNTHYSVNLHACSTSTFEESNLERQVAKFWELENVPTKPILSEAELQCENMFVNNYKIDNGHFQVKLPFKDEPRLGDSLDIATKRFYCLEKRFNYNKEFKLRYVACINDYINLGHMALVRDVINSNDCYILPHHAVLKDTSATTKLRVVFDGSQTTTNGLSLNDNLLAGNTLQQDLFSILIRFRTHKFVIITDIIKMYRQVRVAKEHHRYQRLLWRDDCNKIIETYELTTVPFGLTSAPFLAIRCLLEIARLESHINPVACEVIKRDFYVDNCLSGANTKCEVIIMRDQLINALSKYGFNLSQWASNSHDLLPSEQFNYNQTDKHVINLNRDHDNETKTLGLVWNFAQDSFKYNIKKIVSDSLVTKRTILSVVSQVFDPLGLVNPAIVNVKLLIQTLWSLKLDWDEPIPDELRFEWNKFVDEVGKLNELTIPRRLATSILIHFEIHGFCDASMRAYGACIYVRSVREISGFDCQLLCAKSRIAPLKTVSLPRLELCAALLLSRLFEKVTTALNLSFTKSYLWTDSTIVLSWLSGEPNLWKIFVANRVSEIQALTSTATWHHVRSECNPADILSRGMLPLELMHSRLWWNGPSWLSCDSEKWPINNFELNNTEIPEKRTVKVSLVAINQNFDIFNRYSSFKKLTRVIAWCLRFINALRIKNKINYNKLLTISEMDNAEYVLLKLAQAETFANEISLLQKGNVLKANSPLLSLSPFVDETGILRVGGRLQYGNFDYKKRHPAILAKNHLYTKLIIKNEHLKNLHAGSQFILSVVREKYWPLAGLNTVKGVLKDCIVCFKTRPRKLNVKMGNLPSERIEPSRPFANTSLDFAGPFNIKETKFRNKKFIKAYVCVFVCFSTKACHLELASDLTTQTFLNCLKRFVSRRGLPHIIYSDNATNLVAADKQLREIYQNLDENFKSEFVKNYLLDNKVMWKFMPARSPHFGGLHESAVKSFKIHFKKITKNINLTFEGMCTILCEIEAVLNSRPIHPISNDCNDLSALTPGHFLIGDRLISLPQHDLMHVTGLRQYQHLQKMLQDFWRRWSQSYLYTLQGRGKWKTDGWKNLKINTLVLLRDDNLPPQCWHLGRITSLHPGRDGVVRVVGIKTQHGTTTRAVLKICPLPLEVEDFNAGEYDRARNTASAPLAPDC